MFRLCIAGFFIFFGLSLSIFTLDLIEKNNLSMQKIISQKLTKLIKKIQAENAMNNQRLAYFIEEAGIEEEDIFPFSNFKHPVSESYGRSELFCADNFGIYVMSWCKGDFTAIHSHGHSDWGAVYFLGDADHRTYYAKNKELKLLSSEIIKNGSIAAVCGDMVHAMGNLSSAPFLTLHIYGSNSYCGRITEDSRVFELDKNRIRTSIGPAFLNIEDCYCKYDEEGIVTDMKTIDDFNQITEEFFNRIKKK